MIQVRPIDLARFQIASLTEEAARALAETPFPQGRVAKAWEMVDGNIVLAYGGVAQESLLSLPEVWALLGKEFSFCLLRNVRALRRAVERHAPPGAVMWVDTERGKRFAALIGAEPFREADGWTQMRFT